MDVELIEIRDFLASRAPFDCLPEATLDALPKRLQVRYLRRGSIFPPDDDKEPCLYILRRGAVEIRDADGNLVSKLAEGDLCPSPCGAIEPRMPLPGQTSEDTLAYLLPCTDLARLRTKHPEFSEHFDQSISQRLRRALDNMKQDSSGNTALMTVQVRDLLARDLVNATPDTSIEAAARLMSEANCSSLVITDQDRLAGIVTDRDIVVRGVAHHIASDGRIDSLMSMGVIALDADEDVDELYAVFARHAIRRVPVVDHDRVVGMISLDDAMVSTAAELTDLAGVLSTQIAFPHAREEPAPPAVVDA